VFSPMDIRFLEIPMWAEFARFICTQLISDFVAANIGLIVISVESQVCNCCVQLLMNQVLEVTVLKGPLTVTLIGPTHCTQSWPAKGVIWVVGTHANGILCTLLIVGTMLQRTLFCN
jgi:hypothetical protein